MNDKILDSNGTEQVINSIFLVGKKIFKIAKEKTEIDKARNSIREAPNIFQEMNKRHLNPKEFEKIINLINLIKIKNKVYLDPFFIIWKNFAFDPKRAFTDNLAEKKNLLDKLKQNYDKNKKTPSNIDDSFDNKTNDSKKSKENPRDDKKQDDYKNNKLSDPQGREDSRRKIMTKNSEIFNQKIKKDSDKEIKDNDVNNQNSDKRAVLAKSTDLRLQKNPDDKNIKNPQQTNQQDNKEPNKSNDLIDEYKKADIKQIDNNPSSKNSNERSNPKKEQKKLNLSTVEDENENSKDDIDNDNDKTLPGKKDRTINLNKRLNYPKKSPRAYRNEEKSESDENNNKSKNKKKENEKFDDYKIPLKKKNTMAKTFDFDYQQNSDVDIDDNIPINNSYEKNKPIKKKAEITDDDYDVQGHAPDQDDLDDNFNLSDSQDKGSNTLKKKNSDEIDKNQLNDLYNKKLADGKNTRDDENSNKNKKIFNEDKKDKINEKNNDKSKKDKNDDLNDSYKNKKKNKKENASEINSFDYNPNEDLEDGNIPRNEGNLEKNKKKKKNEEDDYDVQGLNYANGSNDEENGLNSDNPYKKNDKFKNKIDSDDKGKHGNEIDKKNNKNENENKSENKQNYPTNGNDSKKNEIKLNKNDEKPNNPIRNQNKKISNKDVKINKDLDDYLKKKSSKKKKKKQEDDDDYDVQGHAPDYDDINDEYNLDDSLENDNQKNSQKNKNADNQNLSNNKREKNTSKLQKDDKNEINPSQNDENLKEKKSDSTKKIKQNSEFDFEKYMINNHEELDELQDAAIPNHSDDDPTHVHNEKDKKIGKNNRKKIEDEDYDVQGHNNGDDYDEGNYANLDDHGIINNNPIPNRRKKKVKEEEDGDVQANNDNDFDDVDDNFNANLSVYDENNNFTNNPDLGNKNVNEYNNEKKDQLGNLNKNNNPIQINGDKNDKIQIQDSQNIIDYNIVNTNQNKNLNNINNLNTPSKIISSDNSNNTNNLINNNIFNNDQNRDNFSFDFSNKQKNKITNLNLIEADQNEENKNKDFSLGDNSDKIKNNNKSNIITDLKYNINNNNKNNIKDFNKSVTINSSGNQTLLINFSELREIKAKFIRLGAKLGNIIRNKHNNFTRFALQEFRSKFLNLGRLNNLKNNSKNQSLNSINLVNNDISNNKLFSDNSYYYNSGNDGTQSIINNNGFVKKPSGNNDKNIEINNQSLQSKGFNPQKTSNYIIDQIQSEYERENFITEENNNEEKNRNSINNTKKFAEDELDSINSINSDFNRKTKKENYPFENNLQKRDELINFNLDKNERNPELNENKKVQFSNEISIGNNNNKVNLPIIENKANSKDEASNKDKNNDPKYLKYIIGELNMALDHNLNKMKDLSKEISNRNTIISNLKNNIEVLNERNKVQDDIKAELEILNINIKNLDNPIFMKNNNFENNLKLINDRYKNLNLKIEIVKLHENLANKEIIINDLKLLMELSKDKMSICEESNKKLTKEKENLFETIKNQKVQLQDLLSKYNILNTQLNIKKNNTNMINENKYNSVIEEKEIEDKIKGIMEEKEYELLNKLKENEYLVREECLKQINEFNLALQEKISENEKYKFEIELLKSHLENSNFNELEDLKQKIFILETENEKLNLTNKLNSELVSQYEKNSLKNSELLYGINNKENFNSIANNLSKHQYYKNEILVIDLKSQVKKLENFLEMKEKVIENLKEQVKVTNTEYLRKDFELKHNSVGLKNKELAEILIKIQNLEQEKMNLITENDIYKLNMEKAVEKNQILSETIRTKYEFLEAELMKEKSDKEMLEDKLREISKIYKDNHENLVEEANSLRVQLIKRDEEIEKIKSRYEARIHQLKENIEEMEIFRKNIIDELAGNKRKILRNEMMGRFETDYSKYQNMNMKTIMKGKNTHRENPNIKRTELENNIPIQPLSYSFNSHGNQKNYDNFLTENYPSVKIEKFNQSDNTDNELINSKKSYYPYFSNENQIPEKDLEKNLNRNQNLTKNFDSRNKNIKDLKNSMDNLQQIIDRIDQNYNVVANNYLVRNKKEIKGDD